MTENIQEREVELTPESRKINAHLCNIRNSKLFLLLFAFRDIFLQMYVNLNTGYDVTQITFQISNFIELLYPVFLVFLWHLFNNYYRFVYVIISVLVLDCCYQLFMDDILVSYTGIVAIYGFAVVVLLSAANSVQTISRIKEMYPDTYADYEHAKAANLFKKAKKK